MAKSKEACSYCNAKIPVVPFCPKCAQPTIHLSARERIMWELNQWESSRPGELTATAPDAGAPAALAPEPAGNGHAAPVTLDQIRTRPRRSRNVVAERTERGATIQRLRRSGHDPGVVPEPEQAAAPPTSVRPAPSPLVPAASLVAPPRTERPTQTVPAPRGPAESPAAGGAATAPAASPQIHLAPAQAPPVPRPVAAPDMRPVRPPFDLVEGETLIHSIDGWSRGRPARIHITRFRVALVRRPGRTHWIPLDQVEDARIGWRGISSLTITSSIELLTFQSFDRKQLETFEKRLEFEMREALMPGGRRRHPEITQDWADRSTDVWDSHSGQVRLFIRRHPVSVTLAGVTAAAAINLVLQ